METNRPNYVQWITMILAIVLILGGLFYVPGAVGRAVQAGVGVAISTETAKILAAIPEGASAEDIASLIDVDNEKLDRVCELTEGCEFYEGSESELVALDDPEAEEDFEEQLADLLGIDEDYFQINDIEYDGEYQVRAYSKDDKDDDNWECKVFLRVEYEDIDEDENEVVYVVVTSVLDEGEYDSLSIEEVNRRFEFD